MDYNSSLSKCALCCSTPAYDAFLLKILLVQPDYQQEGFGFRLAAMPEPLGLEMLAAYLPDHNVRILDIRCGDELEPAVRAFDPDIVGVTALTPEVYAARDVLREVKTISRDIFTVAGGHHASLVPADFCSPDVDAIVIGEGETVLALLAASLANGPAGPRDLSGVPNLIWRQPDGTFRENPRQAAPIILDHLPLPRRDLVAQHRPKYFFLFDQPDTSVATGRGCPYRCSFCSVWEFYDGQTRMMCPQRVMEELRTVATDHITFVDDNFLLNAQREGQIADMIRAEGLNKRYSMECRTDSIVRNPDLVKKWVDIGLYAALLGLEGTDDTLKAVNKSNSARTNEMAIHILQDHGVVIWGAFLVDPQWDADDFNRLHDYVCARGITHTQFTVLTPLPGTELCRKALADGRLLTHDYTCYDALHAVTTTRLPREEFYRHLANLYRQIDPTPYIDMLHRGVLSIADVKRGKAMLDAMSKWESYTVHDPILGRSSHQGNGDPRQTQPMLTPTAVA